MPFKNFTEVLDVGTGGGFPGVPLAILFPEARFVHIIRDGRNTALSALNWANENKGPGKWSLWKEDSLATCALWWRWQAGSGARDGYALGDRYYHRVKYEDLVAGPETSLKAIAGFLGIPDSEDMVNYHEGKTRHDLEYRSVSRNRR